MFKRQFASMATVILATCFCLLFVQPAHSSIVSTISLDSIAGPLADIAAIQFDILDPDAASVSDFSPNFPSGWIDFSNGDNVNAFDGGGVNSLPIGTIGYFGFEVTLGNWVLGNQDAVRLEEGVDYQVIHNGANYSINAIPIPSTILIFGSGLVGLIGLRRKFKSS